MVWGNVLCIGIINSGKKIKIKVVQKERKKNLDRVWAMSWALFIYSGLKLIYWESGYFRSCVSSVDEIG